MNEDCYEILQKIKEKCQEMRENSESDLRCLIAYIDSFTQE